MRRETRREIRNLIDEKLDERMKEELRFGADWGSGTAWGLVKSLKDAIFPMRAMHVVTQVQDGDHTKEVSIEEVLDAILEHCKVTLGYEKPKQGKVSVAKKPAKKGT